MKGKGIVYLVGAGGGDASGLTLRGAELLRRADIVIYDAQLHPELSWLEPTPTEYGNREDRVHEPATDFEATLERMIAAARAGQMVVRLLSDDPCGFGPGSAEAERLTNAGVPFAVVPGVPALLAAVHSAGIPLTHHQHGPRLTIITEPEAAEGAVDWGAEAKLPGTKVLLMPPERLGPIADRLVAEGLPPETPAALLRGDTPGPQPPLAATLATVGARIAEAGFSGPAIAVIGEAVKLRAKADRLARRPLDGQRVVVTRARAQAGPLVRHLRDLGATVLALPIIKTVPPTNPANIVDVLLELNAYDWLVFTSPNGVTAFFDLFFKRFQDLRDLGGARLAAVGPGTAAALRALHLQVDLMPKQALGAQIAKAFAKFESVENLRICLLRAEVANPELPRALETLGAIVDDVAVYRTVAAPEIPAAADAELRQAGADWITFTSASTVAHFHARYDLPALLRKFPQLKLATIGPETSKALAALALAPAVEAKEHTMEGLVQALRQAAARA